ncbi:MAG: redox-regulated ATPase YchF [Bacteroidota bacterium]
MALKCGIIGLPNVGKSSFYNALCKGNAVSANFPFCTIDPNIGIVTIPDERLAVLTKLAQPAKTIPTTISFVDIAGLVQGASQGEGLGNQFLSHIRGVDALIHVIRCFDNDDIIHVAGGVNPIFDKEIINHELQQADLASLQKRKLKLSKKAQSGDREASQEVQLLDRFIAALSKGQDVKSLSVTSKEEKSVHQWQLLSNKKVIYMANIDEKTLEGGKNQYLEDLREAAKQEQAILIPICVSVELELVSLPEEEQDELLSLYQIKETSLPTLVKAAYRMLNLITYFTVGPKEVRAWTIPCGTLAPAAAGVIHSDLEEGFIKAEVIKYQDYITYGSEEACKKKGKMTIEGKEYLVEDGDILHFKCRT